LGKGVGLWKRKFLVRQVLVFIRGHRNGRRLAHNGHRKSKTCGEKALRKKGQIKMGARSRGFLQRLDSGG